MQEYNFIQDRKDIHEALRRNKRLGKTPRYPKKPKAKHVNKNFLEHYVFSKLEMSPTQLIGNLETQYYSEQDFRDRRQRNVEFIRGRHFNEPVYDAELQRYVSNWQYLRRRNIPPLTYNIVSKFVRSLVGQFREINTGNVVKCDSKDKRGMELSILLTKCLDRIKNHNRFKSKDAAGAKECFASGSPVFKTLYGSKNNTTKKDVRFRLVNRANFMINPGVTDHDFANLHTITEIHDTSLDAIVKNFANADYEKGLDIRDQYIQHQGSEKRQSSYSSQSFDGSQMRNRSFNTQGVGNSAYRYYESWHLVGDYEAITYDPLKDEHLAHRFRDIKDVEKEIEAINQIRKEETEGQIPEEDLFIQFSADWVNRWYVTYITSWGYVLDVMESPFKDALHPYSLTPPDINGEVWGLVEEIIPAQLSMDRQILNADAIVANASKGVWMIPDTSIPDDMTNKEFISEMKKTDGAVVYKVRPDIEGAEPRQHYSNAANVSGNVQQLIQLYSGLVDEISGNYGAAQGQSAAASKTATAYAMESQNASLNVRDVMENYLTLLMDRDELILKFILQGYTKADYLNITGVEIDPAELKMFEFEIEQSKGTNSPAHRLALEQELLNLVREQLMPFEVFMEVSSNPVMQQAKQKFEEFKEKQTMAQQQQMMMQDPNIQQPQNPAQLQEDVISQEMPKLPQV